jgi:hypothetical protein
VRRWLGNLSDRFGRRPLLLLAIFGLGLDFLLSAAGAHAVLAVRRPHSGRRLRVKLGDRQCLYRRYHPARGPAAPLA